MVVRLCMEVGRDWDYEILEVVGLMVVKLHMEVDRV